MLILIIMGNLCFIKQILKYLIVMKLKLLIDFKSAKIQIFFVVAVFLRNYFSPIGAVFCVPLPPD